MKKKTFPCFKYELASLAALMLFFCGVMVFFLSLKENLFIDEALSYMYSNQTFGEAAYIPDLVKIDDPGAFFADAFSAHDRFNYHNVILNQSGDVHPPLYYMILHTVCSLFPGRFSIWLAGAVNILFAVLTLLVLDRILSEFDLPLLARRAILLLCAVSAGVQKNVIFLRMYVMLAFWVTSLTFLFIRERRSKDIRYYLALFLVCLGGCLTHLHFYVYLFSASLVYLIRLIKRRKPRVIAAHTAVVTAAIGCALLIFPYTIRQLLSSNRGMEAREHLFNPAEILPRLKWFAAHAGFDLIGREPLAKGLIIAACALVVFFVRRDRAVNAKLIQLLLPSVLFAVPVAVTASFKHTRYLYAIYPTVACGLWLILFIAAGRLPKHRKLAAALAAAVGLIMTVSAYWSADFTLLYRGYEKSLDALSSYADTDCLYIIQNPGIYANIFGDYAELSRYASLTVVTADEADPAQIKEVLGDKSELIVVTDAGYFTDFQDPTESVIAFLKENDLPSRPADTWALYGTVKSFYCRSD